MKDFIIQNQNRFLEELLALLKIPSISASSNHRQDMIDCATAVKEALLNAGADKAELYDTPGHPIVFGEKIPGPLCWCMDIMMCNLQTHWIYGILPRLNLQSGMVKFMQEAPATTKDSSTCMLKPWR